MPLSPVVLEKALGRAGICEGNKNLHSKIKGKSKIEYPSIFLLIRGANIMRKKNL